MNELDMISNLSKALYFNDPAGTCCVENEMYDEYDSVAAYIVDDLITFGISIEEAITLEFKSLFGFVPNSNMMNKIIEAYNEANNA